MVKKLTQILNELNDEADTFEDPGVGIDDDDNEEPNEKKNNKKKSGKKKTSLTSIIEKLEDAVENEDFEAVEECIDELKEIEEEEEEPKKKKKDDDDDDVEVPEEMEDFEDNEKEDYKIKL